MTVSSFLNMEFRNVVFNAARDGKLRRLKVRSGANPIKLFTPQGGVK